MGLFSRGALFCSQHLLVGGGRGKCIHPRLGAGCLGPCLRRAYLLLDSAPHRSPRWVFWGLVACVVLCVCPREEGRLPEYGAFCFVLFSMLFFPLRSLFDLFWHCIWIQDGLLLLAVVCVLFPTLRCVSFLSCAEWGRLIRKRLTVSQTLVAVLFLCHILLIEWIYSSSVLL